VKRDLKRTKLGHKKRRVDPADGALLAASRGDNTVAVVIGESVFEVQSNTSSGPPLADDVLISLARLARSRIH
jgi:hypothetical protein